jgi:biopolymer transport protein TolR
MISTGSSNGRKLDFDLNIVPIVDCLTILVTFMLAAGVYTSVAMLDVKVSGGPVSAVPASRSAVDLSVELREDLSLHLKVSGQESRSAEFPARESRPDGTALAEVLVGLKARFPEVRSVTLVAHRESPYQEVITVMDAVRGSHPDVVLGGF